MNTAARRSPKTVRTPCRTCFSFPIRSRRTCPLPIPTRLPSDEFARRFPDGYDTTVGEKGFGLSGGQKQRISIARALFKDANVLVLDDVTSALDLDTERSIFRNLKAECGDKTLVIVTHRATALKDCDEIIFLDRGEIVERGSFAELMAQRGNFAEIYERQLSEVAYEE